MSHRSRSTRAALVKVVMRRNRRRYKFAMRNDADEQFTFSIVALEQRDIDTPTIAQIEVDQDSSIPAEALIESLQMVKRNELRINSVRDPAISLEFHPGR